jgi:hypothetical protein
MFPIAFAIKSVAAGEHEFVERLSRSLYEIVIDSCRSLGFNPAIFPLGMDEEFSCAAQLHGRPPIRRGRYLFQAPKE